MPINRRLPILFARSPLTLFGLLLAGVLSLCFAATFFKSEAALQTQDPTPTKTKTSTVIPGEILVRFKSDSAFFKTTTRSELALAIKNQIVNVSLERLDHSDEIVPGLRLAKCAAPDTASVIQALKLRHDVLYAEPNYRRFKEAVPNDARYSELWALKNTGQNAGTIGTDIDAEIAWNSTTGSSTVVVGVIDEGIDVNHADLQPNIWHNPAEIAGNNIDDDNNGFVDDVVGYDFFHNDGSVYDGPGTNPDGSEIDAHGTHVAGTLGAAGNNGTGVVGVNWQVRMMSLKFLGPDGGSTSDVLRAYSYVKMMKERWESTGGSQGANVRVLNNSYGGTGFSQAEFDAIKALDTSGVLFVGAAGNEGNDNDVGPDYPASYEIPNVISVAASNRREGLAGFSNRGAMSVHLAAPGVEILSTIPGNAYAFADGTSMACPQVSGVAALILAANPNATTAKLKASILFGAEQLPAYSATITGARLNAANAMQNGLENDTTAPATISSLHIAAQDDRVVTLNWNAPGDDGNTGQASFYEIRFVDQVTSAQILLAYKRPAAPGSAESMNVNIPFRHPAGSFVIRTLDNVGNFSDTSVAASVTPPSIANAYSVSESAHSDLSTGGSQLFMQNDDRITPFGLPFSFPFYDRYYSIVSLSTNGAMYFDSPPAHDAPGRSQALNRKAMIAAAWDDLDLRTCARADSDIYRVIPNADSVIFRWQGVVFEEGPCNQPPANPKIVNFEIELRRDGTIIKRYGQNSPLSPVVGIGGGEPESYLIASHTSESAPLDLTNAQNITYSLQRLPKVSDLSVSLTADPQVSMVGQTTTYNLTATNLGPSSVVNAVLTDTLPGFSELVSCTTSKGTCVQTAPFVLTINTGALAVNQTVSIEIVVRTTLGASSPYTNSVNISSNLTDLNTNNNFQSVTTQAAQPNLNPQTGLAKIAAGSSSSFAIRNDGNGLAWGEGNHGQLGDGGLSMRLVPVRIVGVSSLIQIDSGAAHTIALRANGSVWSWGLNDKGELGVGTTLDNRRPAIVPGLSGITQISAGGLHNLALKSDGTVWAWGDNSSGQLGDGTNADKLSPIQVPNLSGVIAVAAGVNHSLALKNDGSVWSWGANDFGQLGAPVSAARNVPAQVSGVSNVVSIVAGDGYSFFDGLNIKTISFSAAIRSDGSVWTWGSNWKGQLGDGTMTDRSTPAPVTGMSGVTAIAAGGYHMIALKNDGTVWCWGGNFHGQCGDTTLNDRTTPGKVVWLTGITALAAGREHSLALRQDGHLFGWGSYDSGQLGNGSQVGSQKFPFEVSQQIPDPLPVGSLQNPILNPDGGAFVGTQNVVIRQGIGDRFVSSYLAGGQHVVARLTDGTTWGWGNNQQGQLGFDAGQPQPDPLKQKVKIPVPVVGFDGWTQIVADDTHNIGLKSDGTVWTWGGNEWGQLGYSTVNIGPKQVPGLTNVVSVAAQNSGSLAVKSDGTVWRWGFGLITGVGDVISRVTPVQVAGLSGISKAADLTMNFVIKSDGTVWGWGKNDVGQLGIGNFADSWTPVQVQNLNNVVSAGNSVALKSDGTVWTWGWNLNGRLGTGAPNEAAVNTPQKVSVSNIVAIAPGNDHCLALRSDGTVWGWGSNINGKLGDGNQFNHFTPFQIPGLSNIIAVAVGHEYSTALRSDGTLFLWGKNEFGQIGDGSLDSYFTPTPMTTISGGVSIHYTTNGIDPTENDPEIPSGGSVQVAQSMTLKARAFKDGWNPSGTKAAAYTISTAPNIQLSQANYSASEGDSKLDITVTRTGDTSIASSINYTTSDAAGADKCNVANGHASALCDYITKSGKLTFAPGESAKTLSILLIDDAYVEGTETFNITLSGPTSAALTSPGVATITINDNDATNGTNPMDAAAFFVRQHYLDFLNREPDANGLAFWTNEITSCGSNNTCVELKRINVSAAFFLSIEFQETGYLVYRINKSSFGNLNTPPGAPVPVKFGDFLNDSQEISKGVEVGIGDWQAKLEANKQAYALAFVQRSDFQTAFPSSMTADQFVTKLNTNAGGVLSASENSALVAALNANPGDLTLRAATLRAVADDPDLRDLERSKAFVLMQYFGYLRRNPSDAPDGDFAGYNFWLGKLNQFNGNFIQAELVKAFITSLEYKQRFGP